MGDRWYIGSSRISRRGYQRRPLQPGGNGDDVRQQVRKLDNRGRLYCGPGRSGPPGADGVQGTKGLKTQSTS